MDSPPTPTGPRTSLPLTTAPASTKTNQTFQLAPTLIVGSAACAVLIGPIPVALLGAIVYVAVSARWPRGAVIAVILSLPTVSLMRLIGRLDFSPTEILIVLSAAAAAVRTVWDFVRLYGVRSTRRYVPEMIKFLTATGDPAVTVLATLVVLAAAISLTTSIAPHQSLQSFRVVILEPTVFFGLIVTQLRGRRDAQLLALALIVAGAGIAAFGLWQYVTGDRIITAEAGLRRIRGFYGSPNNLGLFLGRSLPVAVAGALWWPGRRVWLVVAALLCTVGLVLTFSVGAWVAVALSLLLVAWLHGGRTFRTALGVLTVGAIGSMALAVSIPRLGSHFDLSSGTSSIRIYVWQSALRMLADHPMRGIGLDNFLSYYQGGYRLPAAWQDPSLSHPHNVVLDFWLSLGLIGPVLLGCLIVRFCQLVRQGWRRADQIERGLYAGVTGAMADTMIHGMVDNSFFLPDLAVLFWLLFAIVCVARTQDRLPLTG